MTTILIATTSHNNLSNRGEASLDRMIDSVRVARTELSRAGAASVWSWLDDGSTDGTAAWVEARLRPRDEEIFTANEAQSFVAASRNMAVARRRSDIVNTFDSDDEMYPHHLVAGLEALDTLDEGGLHPGVVSLMTDVGGADDIHPGWLGPISMVQLNTTFFRRSVWDFVEGLPPLEIYGRIGCEDQDMIAILEPFFPMALGSIVTARYWRYPGSYFDRQIDKFRTEPVLAMRAMAATTTDRDQLHRVREHQVRERIAYLKAKLSCIEDLSAFRGLRTGPAFVELGLSY